jgi:hypothetical protein
MTDSPVKRDHAFIDRVAEDIRDLLEHATEHADLAKCDAALFQDAADVLHPAADRDAPEFYAKALSVLDRLNTIVQPATACGVRFARRAALERGSPERRRLRRARDGAIASLAVAFAVYGYVACGGSIVRTIEQLRTQISQNAEQIHTLVAASPAVAPAPAAGTTERASAPPPAPAPAPGPSTGRATSAPAPASTPTPSPAPAPSAPPAGGTPPPAEQAAPQGNQPASPQAREADQGRPPPQGPAPVRGVGPDCSKPESENLSGVAWTREYCRLTSRARDLNREFDAAHNRLHEWRDIFFSPHVFFFGYPSVDATCFGEASLLDHAAQLQPTQRAGRVVTAAGNSVLLSAPACFGGAETLASADELNDHAYEFRQRREQQARSILDTLTLILLPGMFGLLGAMLAHVRELYGAMSEHRIEPTMFTRSGLRFLLGMVLGALVGVMLPPNIAAQNAELSLIAFAFLAGYSVETAFHVLNQIIERVLRGMSDEPTRHGGQRRRDRQPPAEHAEHAPEHPPGEGDRPRPIAAVRR